ncbi:hypothetical protein DM194_15170 (plasmid) [Azospirillum ramasamyi]|uniref:Uncharacterized protein n=1 Tax=Azospirillum ramasamyi TaxID=682998 RepID=A0A2U9S9P7_9PROT|nr:hypothetical protein DM194_15170 [Azospirillum ramasamyi]
MESWNDARKLFNEFIRFETTIQQRAVWALDSQHAFLVADIPNLPAIWHALDIDHVGHVIAVINGDVSESDFQGNAEALRLLLARACPAHNSFDHGKEVGFPFMHEVSNADAHHCLR